MENNKQPPATAGTAKKARAKRPSRPGPGRPTRQQARQRNLELLDLALDQFLQKGYERTTIEGIATSVGMAKRTVYTLYGDKKTLFKAALERAINEWIMPVEELRALETDNLEETLLSIGQLLVDNVMTPAGLKLLRITNAEANHMPEISAYTYEQGTGPTLEFLSAMFARRLKLAAPVADEAALSFLYLVVGGPASLSMWGVPMDKRRIRQHTDYSVRLFLHGILP
ncbi:TetR/AcrR family transcriptional regulator [Haliea sp. E17]|uniref:TetR/AcrR family transcriptional regulator n=1 Tax=Haliea sp. E17 TaxID=3401576 RepID=UPI003AAC6C6C